MQNHRRCSGEIWANLKIFLKLSYLQTFPDASIASKQVPFGRVHCILTAPGWIKRVIFTSTSDVSIAYLLPLLDCIVFEFRWQFSDSIYNIYTFSMTSLLTHTVTHSTRPSFRPKSNNQPLKKFLSLAVSWVKVVKNGKIFTFKVNFLCQKLSESF